jgi:hypothetical protein
MNKQAIDLINTVIDAVRVVDFYKEDPDHVLFHRFRRLHFHNLLKKHSELQELDEQMRQVETAMKGQDDGTDHPDAFKCAQEYEDLLIKVDNALKNFGMRPQSLLCVD